jgi:hypothetical protein
MSEEQGSGADVIRVSRRGAAWVVAHGEATEQFPDRAEALRAAQAWGRATGAAVAIDSSDDQG